MGETLPARTRNRRGEGARLREDIVDAAVELLDETGDESAVTLRAVARRVGIAAPSIYRHFPDQPSIMLAAVQRTFAQLEAALEEALEEALEAALATSDADPPRRLFAVCNAYLEFAQDHPGRYRTMFGGLWMPDLDESTPTANDLASLGDGCLRMLTDGLEGCVTAGCATSTDLSADTIALWLGLHGLAHQRASTVAFPWPPDIAARIIASLAHLRET